MALSVEEPQLGCIISGRIHSEQQDTPRQLQAAGADWLFTRDPSLTPSSCIVSTCFYPGEVSVISTAWYKMGRVQ